MIQKTDMSRLFLIVYIIFLLLFAVRRMTSLLFFSVHDTLGILNECLFPHKQCVHEFTTITILRFCGNGDS